MAALRKKYQGRADIAPSKADSAPVMAEPPARTSMPPVDTSPPPEDILSAEPEPVEEAGRAAILQRITELERAEAISQKPQPPQFANEPPEQDPLEQVLATMPEGVRGWLRARPQYLTDPEKNAQIQHAHLVAARESGDAEFGPQYYERLEHHLGLRPQRQPQQTRSVSRPVQQRQTSVSAPPTRDSISMSTGRPTGGTMSLSGEEREFARMVGLSDAEYAENKRRMLATQQ
jgi:hypothetical protein